MRKIIYSEQVKKTRPPSQPMEPYQPVIYYEIEEQGEAFFHQWGIDYEATGENSGSFTVAIIELKNGVVKSIPADQIRFVNPTVI